MSPMHSKKRKQLKSSLFFFNYSHQKAVLSKTGVLMYKERETRKICARSCENCPDMLCCLAVPSQAVERCLFLQWLKTFFLTGSF